MDGVGNDNGGVLLLGATNLPWALDPAVRRRFQRKIHIPLPDEKARRQLFKIESAKEMQVDLKKADLIELAAKTRGFSGSDISNVLQDALDIPIKAIQQATHYRKVSCDFPADQTYGPNSIPGNLRGQGTLRSLQTT